MFILYFFSFIILALDKIIIYRVSSIVSTDFFVADLLLFSKLLIDSSISVRVKCMSK